MSSGLHSEIWGTYKYAHPEHDSEVAELQPKKNIKILPRHPRVNASTILAPVLKYKLTSQQLIFSFGHSVMLTVVVCIVFMHPTLCIVF
jgi:hypothetical protein